MNIPSATFIERHLRDSLAATVALLVLLGGLLGGAAGNLLVRTVTLVLSAGATP